MDSQFQTADDDEVLSVDIRRYLHAIAKYKWLIAAIVAVAVTGAVLYTNRQIPIYQATASVKVDPRLPDLLGQGQEIMQIGAGTSSIAEYYRAERQIMLSFQLLRRTVEENELHVQLLGAAQREEMTRDEMMDLATRRLSRILSVSTPEQNRIFLITVRHRDPKIAAQIANAHVASYVAYTRGQLSVGTQKASKFLASELDIAQEALIKAETSVVDFEKANDITALPLENRQSIVSSNITHYTTKLREARDATRELDNRLARMKRAIEDGDILDSPVFGLSKSTLLESLKSQYYLERNKFKELAEVVGPKHEDYRAQKQKMDELLGALTAEAKLVVRTLEEERAQAAQNVRELAALVDENKREAYELGPKIVEYNELQRRRKSAEDKYNIVVARLGTSDITSRIDSINVTPLDPARAPSAPVYPSLKRNVTLAGSGALVFGIAVALFLAFLDRSVKTVEDVQAATGAPVLGVIPMLAESELTSDNDKARDLYVFEHPTSRVAECCRSLRTNILFSAADRPLKAVVVSSSHPREGKTTSVMYLGTTMAQSGQRVLLIDSDMRRPRLHQSTGVSRQRGLSNLIVGDAAYEDVIKTTEIPNLFLLPCGPLPPNPAELLMTKRFEAVLAELGRRFDRIILDSPPLQAVTDAVVLSKQTDGVILVVKAGKTLRDDVARSAKQITSVGGTIVGVILNELDMEDRRYGYYQYYSYGSDQAETEPA